MLIIDLLNEKTNENVIWKFKIFFKIINNKPISYLKCYFKFEYVDQYLGK